MVENDDDSRTFLTPSPVRKSQRVRTPIKCNATTCFQTCGGTCGRPVISKRSSQSRSPVVEKSKDIYDYTSSDNEETPFDFASVYSQAKKTLAAPIIVNLSSKSTAKATSTATRNSKSTTKATDSSTVTSKGKTRATAITTATSSGVGRKLNFSATPNKSRGIRRNRGSKLKTIVQSTPFTPAAIITPRAKARGSLLKRTPVIRKNSKRHSNSNDMETPTRNKYANRVKPRHVTKKSLDLTVSSINSVSSSSSGPSSFNLTRTSSSFNPSSSSLILDVPNNCSATHVSGGSDNEIDNENTIATSASNSVSKSRGKKPKTSHDLVSSCWKKAVDIPSHIENRIIISNVIYQYYDKIPQSIVDIKDKDPSQLLHDEIIEKFPVYGVVHLFHVSKFLLPKDFRTKCIYLGHKLDPYWAEIEGSAKRSLQIPEHVVVCDSFLWKCVGCTTLNKSTTIFSSSTKSFRDIYSHFKNHHSKDSDGDGNSIDDASGEDDGDGTLNKVRYLNKDDEIEERTFETFRKDSKRHQEITRLVLDLLIRKNIPFNIVDDDVWYNFITFICPKFNFISRRTLERKLKEYVENEVIPHRDDYLREQEGLGLTFDAWTTSANQAVLGIRVCYIDENFDFHVETIATERITGSHDAKLFEMKIKEIIEKRGLYGKIAYAMADNGANVLLALAHLDDIGDCAHEAVINVLDPTLSTVDGDNEETDKEIRRAIKLLEEAYLNKSKKDSMCPVKVDIRFLCPGLNYTDSNTCVPHSAQVLLKETIKKSTLLMAIETRIGDLALFCTKRTEIRDKLKFLTGLSMIVAPKTRWSFVVASASRLLEVMVFMFVI